jgi:hypothetical protein
MVGITEHLVTTFLAPGDYTAAGVADLKAVLIVLATAAAAQAAH